MNDPMQALVQASARANLFPPNSRYPGVDTATLATVEGGTSVYLKRRFVPPPERFALLQEHALAQGERLDHIAAQYLGDPELFWRLCDANAAMRPDEITETPGRRLRITLPEGIPGAPHA